MKTKNSLIIFFSVLILILAGGCSLSKLNTTTTKEQTTVLKQEEAAKEKKWSVIYLTSGEIYIARLTYPVSASELSFPSGSYMMQIVKSKGEKGEDKSNFQLTPFDEFLWAPTDLFVNRDQIVFYGPVKEESGVGKAIKDAGKWDEAAAGESK